ncbi:hypothetical protein BSKO_08538 [Bryopsis sp. KO-2023]|nr:hypothetical protein BSKO_08538 [Bryopsis sp. KO-2023]
MDLSDPFIDFNRAPSMDLDEYMPVDNFFDNYITQLENTGTNSFVSSQRATPGLHDAKPNLLPTGQIPSAPYNVRGQPLSGVPVANNLVDPYQQQQQGCGLASGSLSGMLNPTAPFDAQPQQMLPRVKEDYATQHQPDFSGGYVGRPNTALDVGQVGYMTSSPFTSSASGGASVPFPTPGQVVTSTEPSKLPTVRGKPVAFGRNRNRTVRQQTLNKQAQQRYRQRKKAKAVELELAVESLSEEIQQLKAVREEKRLLEERTMELERNLLEKEAEIERIKIQNVSKKGSEKDSNCSDMSSTDLEKDVDREPSRQAAEFHSRVRDLEDLLRKRMLQPSQRSDPSTRDVSEPVLKEVSKGVYEVCMMCVRVLRLDGPNLWDLIQGKVGGGLQFEPHGRDRWMEIAESLQLSADQMKLAAMLRNQHLQKFEKISIERQALNLQTIALLLPSEQGGHAPVFGKISCFSISGFIQRSKHSSKTHQALDKLKHNLREEQKLISELEYMTFNRIMNPIQGAWAILSSYPLHCDCLTLLEAICELKPSSDSQKSIPDGASQTAQEDSKSQKL